MLKIKYLLNILLFSLLSLVLVSCIKPGIELKDIDCPELLIECNPYKFDIGKIDTTKIHNDYKFIIEKVNGLNSYSDDWQLSKFNNRYYLTYSDGGLNKIIEVKKNKINQFFILKGLQLPDNTHFGSLIGYKSKGFISLSNIINTDEEIVEINKSFGNSKIYEIEYSDYILSNLKEVSINKENNVWYGHPCLFPEKDILFFSSDMKGGYGGTDIWYIYRIDDNHWSKPINCGPNINTSCDDITPFISIDGKELYFSSSGHSTVGGYDLFVSEISDQFLKNYKEKGNYFSLAKNLKEPINTIYDEIFPFSDTDTDSVLYYSSNQDKNFDIFVFYKSKIELKTSKEDNIVKTEDNKKVKDKINVTGKVIEQQSKTPIENAQIDIIEVPNETDKQKIFTDYKGEFNIELFKNKDYQLTAHKDEFFYDSKKITVDTNLGIIIFELPRRGEIRINFPLDEYQNPYKYTLDSNGIETGRTWQEELDLVADNIKLALDRIQQVVLVGHTDDIASVEYNYKLGERRVNFVISELVKRGIPREILVGRSAGKLEPLERKANETIDTYRKRLRRVTIEKILVR